MTFEQKAAALQTALREELSIEATIEECRNMIVADFLETFTFQGVDTVSV